MGYDLNDDKFLDKIHLAVLLFIYLTENLFKEKQYLPHQKIKHFCNLFNSDNSYTVYESFKEFCIQLNYLALLDRVLNNYLILNNTTEKFYNDEIGIQEEVQNDFLLKYLLSIPNYNYISTIYLSPNLEDFVCKLKNLVPDKSEKVYKPILKGLALEELFTQSGTINIKKVNHLKGVYFETIVIELEKLSNLRNNLPRNSLFILSDYNNFEIDLANKATKELIEIKYREDHCNSNLEDYKKYLIDTKQLSYYEKTTKIKDLTKHKKIVIYTEQTFIDEDGVLYQNFMERYKHLDVLVPWNYDIVSETNPNQISLLW